MIICDYYKEEEKLNKIQEISGRAEYHKYLDQIGQVRKLLIKDNTFIKSLLDNGFGIRAEYYYDRSGIEDLWKKSDNENVTN
jgi:hypothetical protein